jgi:hypothetical protein
MRLLLSLLVTFAAACSQQMPMRCDIAASIVAEIEASSDGWLTPTSETIDPRVLEGEWSQIGDRGRLAVEFEHGTTSVTEVASLGANVAGVTVRHVQREPEQPWRVWRCIVERNNERWHVAACYVLMAT